MKRIFLFWIAGVLLATSGVSAETLQAELYKKDGGAWYVFLVKNGGEELTIRLNKSKVNRTILVDEVERLNIQHPEYDEAQVQQKFDEADYAAVITVLEPVAASSADYMGIPNNLQNAFGLLMNAYYWNGDHAKANTAALKLGLTQDPVLKLSAMNIQALTAMHAGNLAEAETVLSEISDPAAKLYLQACLQQANQQPEAAIQTAVELIANHPNDMRWMPVTELLCANLYLDMGRTNSAIATARQTEKFYAGTSIGKEAQTLRETLEKSEKIKSLK